MISKNTIKLIKSLAVKKFRIKENLFLVEGDKNVIEVLNSGFTVELLYATNNFLNQNESRCTKAGSVIEVDSHEIRKASLLKNPQNCIAICTLPNEPPIPEKLNNNLSVFLDEIQDPGNLGTIIRICDWFKVEYLFCSSNTADLYNPKVIQASMGSFSRVNICRSTFEDVIKIAAVSRVPIYGAFLNGKNIYKENLPEKAILVIGNEGKGIKNKYELKIDKKIKIPNFSTDINGAESLNVSAATAIICSEFNRQKLL